MDKKLLKEWLVEFKDTVIKNLKESFYNNIEHSDVVQDFAQKLKDEKITTFEELKSIFLELFFNYILIKQPTEYLTTYSFEEYIEKFKHLFNTNLPIEDRIDAAIYTTPYQMKDFSKQDITDLVYYNEPKEYIRFDTDFQSFIDALKLEKTILKKQKLKSYGQFFKAFNDVIKEEVLEIYCEVFYNKKSNEIEAKDLYSKTSLMYEIGGFIFDAVLFNIKKFNNGFIHNIALSNFYSIKEEGIQLNGLENNKFIFLLGENGTGKTVLLKAILLALKKSFIKEHTSKEETGLILQILDDNKNAVLNISLFKETNQLIYQFDEFNRFYLQNCYAYGTQRNKISHSIKAEPYGFLSLFQPNQFMINVENWLLNIERKELKGEKTIGVEGIERILGQVLDYPNLKILIKENGIGEVFFKLEHQEYKLYQLSEGFQTIMIFVIDLLSRLTTNNPTIAETKDFRAVVLVDELDLFLHPKWEKNICGKLHSIFPNIQFFVTTHSPILVDGAVKDKRIKNTQIAVFKLGLKEGATYVERSYTGDLIEDWTPNLLINSELFDDGYLDDLDEKVVKELRSANNEVELLKIGKSLKVLQNRSKELKERYLQSLKNN